MSPIERGTGSKGSSDATELFVVAGILCFIFLIWLHVTIFKAVGTRRVVLGIHRR